MAKVTIWKRDDGPDMDDLRALLESLASIIDDDELSASERSSMLAQTFDEYRDFTGGRDGLADIAATRGSKAEKGIEKMDNDNMDRGAVAMIALEGAAVALQKAQPNLTKEQAFAKVYVDPRYSEAMKAERQASRARLAGGGVAETRRQASRSGTPWSGVDPEILDDLSDEEIGAWILEERRRNPFLTPAELYARVSNSIAVREPAAAFRATMAAARRDGSTWMSEGVDKRDDAMSELQEKASDLQRAQPALTAEGAFAEAYRLYPELAKAERSASRAALFG